MNKIQGDDLMKMIRIIYIIILLMLIVMCNCCKCYAVPPGMAGNQSHQNDGGGGGTYVPGDDTLMLPNIDNSYKPSVSLNTANSRVGNIISKLLGFLTVIGICVLVVSTAAIGFDFMMGSANQKAISKEKLVGILIASILLTGGSILAKIIINIGESI